MTYDVIIIIKTFYMSINSDGENFHVNPTSSCRQKHTRSVRTNKQTDTNVISSHLARVLIMVWVIDVHTDPQHEIFHLQVISHKIVNLTFRGIWGTRAP